MDPELSDDDGYLAYCAAGDATIAAGTFAAQQRLAQWELEKLLNGPSVHPPLELSRLFLCALRGIHHAVKVVMMTRCDEILPVNFVAEFVRLQAFLDAAKEISVPAEHLRFMPKEPGAQLALSTAGSHLDAAIDFMKSVAGAGRVFRVGRLGSVASERATGKCSPLIRQWVKAVAEEITSMIMPPEQWWPTLVEIKREAERFLWKLEDEWKLTIQAFERAEAERAAADGTWAEEQAPGGSDTTRSADGFQPAKWFTLNTNVPATRLRQAVKSERKTMRVQKKTIGALVLYCVEDVRRWWPGDMERRE